MSKPKPLEWYVAKPGDYETNGIPILANNDRGFPFYIGWAAYMGTAPTMGPEANAHLMAAAPKLRDALKDLLEIPEFDGTRATSLRRKTIKDNAKLALKLANNGLEE